MRMAFVDSFTDRVWVKPDLQRAPLMLVLALSILPAPALAQWRPDGVPVCATTNNQWNPTIVADGAGGAIVTWVDSRSGNDDIYAQWISAAGAVQWAANGVALCTNIGEQHVPIITSDGAGGAIVTWSDYRTGNYDIYAQRVLAGGAARWTADGAALCTAIGSQLASAIVSDGAGGAIVSWNDDRSNTNYYDIYAQRVSADGAAKWTADGVALCTATGAQYFSTIVSDGASGAIVTWQDHRNGNGDIYAQRIDSTGTVKWTTDGAAICTATGDQMRPTIVSDGAGGAIITWQDGRLGGGSTDIYAQRISAAGAVQWTANGVPLCTFSGRHRKPAIVSDGAGGAIVTWYDDGGYIDAQRILAGGTVQWTANGVILCIANASQQFPVIVIVSDGEGGAVVAWLDQRDGGGNSDVYAQRISAGGAVQWPNRGAPLCAATGSQDYPAIVSDGAGGAVVAWQDPRSGNANIYAQHTPFTIAASHGLGGSIEPDGATLVPAGTDTSFSIKCNDPGYYVSDVSVDSKGIGPVASYTFPTVVRNHTLQALFDNRTMSGSVATSARTYASFAFSIAPAAPADLVQSVLGALWPPDDMRWRLAHWDPASGSGGAYVFANTGLEVVAPGLGYWLITSGPQTIQWQGAPLPAEPYALTLTGPAGWQQIGNPFRYPIADTALWVMSGAAGCQLTDPANGLTEPRVYEAGYSTPVVHTLLPGKAYWLKKTVEAELSLLFPERTSTGPATEPAMMKPEGALWALAVVVRQEGREAGPVLVGAERSPAVGGSALRRLAAPGPPEASARVTVAGDATGEQSAEYAWSFKPEASEMSWDLALAVAEAPGEMALTLTPLDLPVGARVWLSDPREGWTRELSSGGEVSIAAFAGERTLRLTVVAASGIPPASVPGRSAWRAYPNPFAGTAGLMFSLEAPGDAAVEIFDVQGRSVRQLDRPGLAAGEHVLVWDGRDEVGRPARPGVYLARYRSGAATGVVRLVRVE